MENEKSCVIKLSKRTMVEFQINFYVLKGVSFYYF